MRKITNKQILSFKEYLTEEEKAKTQQKNISAMSSSLQRGLKTAKLQRY